MDDIAISEDGTLYAISNFGGSGNQAFGFINKTTGAWTEMGDYGIQDVESLAFTATGQLIATTGKDGNQSNQLYTIDAGTGVATYVGSIAPGADVEGCDCITANLINLQIGDRVWDDADEDGIQDSGESGIAGVTVNLLTNTGSPYLNDLGSATTTTTDAQGYYLFDELPEGEYIVEFVLPNDKLFTSQDVGSDNTIDSDANIYTGRTGIIILAGSVNDLSVDAGLRDITMGDSNVYAEAECSQVGSIFNVISDASASGGSYVLYPDSTDYNNPPTTSDGWIRFNAAVETGGNYYIYARTWATSTADDSWWVRVNEGSWVKYNNIPITTGWEWNQVWDSDNSNTPVLFTFQSGINTIDFAHRENGAKLDKINISGSLTPPTGEGGAPYNCPDQFSCDSKLYQTIEVSGDYWLYELQTSPMNHIPLMNLTASGVVGEINNTSFNRLDGYIYTINIEYPFRLYRIGGDLSVHYLGNISGLPLDAYLNAAD